MHQLEGDSSNARHQCSLPPTQRSLDKDQPLLRTALRPLHLHPIFSATESFDQFFDKLETVLLKYPRDPGRAYSKPAHMRPKSIHLSRSECMRVWQQYFTLRNTTVSETIRHSLTLHTFNNWLHSDAQLLTYLRLMFVDLDLPMRCKFPTEILETWILVLYRRYNNVPFHNFKHAFAVTQMMYSIIKQAQLSSVLSAVELLALMFSALSHDLDHPGFTNSYQVNVGSWLALRYNDNSPLENHHCAVAFDLISCPYTNILCGMEPSESRWFRKVAIKCILATDMSSHTECVQKFRQLLPSLLQNAPTVPCDVNSPSRSRDSDCDSSHLRQRLSADSDSRLTVMLILLKVCDLSNEVRPSIVADPWLDCLLDEFFYQARAERRLGLPVAPHMDPDKVTRCSSQTSFLTGILVPLLDDVVSVFPELEPMLLGAKERIIYFQSLSTRPSQQTDLTATQPSTHEQPISLTSITSSVSIGHMPHDTARLANLEDRRRLPTDPAASSFVAQSVVTTVPANAHMSRPITYTPQVNDNPLKCAVSSLATGVLSADVPISLLQKDSSVSEQSIRYSSQPNVVTSPITTTTTRMYTGFGGRECDLISDIDLLAENAPSRKSSTGSMVIASS